MMPDVDPEITQSPLLRIWITCFCIVRFLRVRFPLESVRPEISLVCVVVLCVALLISTAFYLMDVTIFQGAGSVDRRAIGVLDLEDMRCQYGPARVALLQLAYPQQTLRHVANKLVGSMQDHLEWCCLAAWHEYHGSGGAVLVTTSIAAWRKYY